MKTDKPLTETEPAEILKGIKEHVRSINAQESRLGSSYKLLYLDVFYWCTKIVASGKAKSLYQAGTDLAKMVKKPAPTVMGWFNSGKFMVENNLQAENTDHVNIREATHCKGTMSTNDFGKVLKLIRENGSRQEVRDTIRQGQIRSGYETKRRVKQARNAKGQFTSQMLRSELKVLADVARELFGKNVDVHVFDNESEESLMVV